MLIKTFESCSGRATEREAEQITSAISGVGGRMPYYFTVYIKFGGCVRHRTDN
jgi:hypothetical protein